MTGSNLSQLPDGPFVRMRALLSGVEAEQSSIDLGIGEPRHAPPEFVLDTLDQARAGYGRYPPNEGTPEFRQAAAGWLSRRFALSANLIDADRQILPVNGTREALFLAAFLAPEKQRPVVLIPNPFYQTYAGAALVIGAEPVFVPALPEKNFLPDYSALDEEILARTVLVYICSPSNPQGTVASKAYWQRLFDLSRKYGFLIFSDESYAEIYDVEPPLSALNEADARGNTENLLVFHSLSKRSNLPGLRSGFVVGDADLIKRFAKLRLYGGAPSPMPVLAAAAATWSDDAHVAVSRQLYREKFDCAERVLAGRFKFYRPPGGFFLWLDVSETGLSDEEAAKQLWRKTGVRVLPGSYLSREVHQNINESINPGASYLRLALVHDVSAIEKALTRVNQFL